MGKHADLSPAQARGIHHRGVGEPIQNDHIPFGHQRTDGPEGSRVAAGEGQSCGGAFEIRQALFQSVMGREGSTNEPRSAGAGAIALDGFDRCRFEHRMVCEAKIIVGRKIQERLAIDFDESRLGRVDPAQLTPQALRLNAGQALAQHPFQVRHTDATPIAL